MPSAPDPRPNTTRRVRLKGFDYRTPGYYFITICQQDRQHMFSSIENQINHFLPPGRMLADAVQELPGHFQNTTVDAFVVMPNHIHIPLGINLSDDIQQRDSVIDVVGWWKTVTTKR